MLSGVCSGASVPRGVCSRFAGMPRGVCPSAQSRGLSLHEYQSSALMSKFGLPSKVSCVASSPLEVRELSRKLLSSGISSVVMKAQVFAGGRGKGTFTSGLKSGVQFGNSSETLHDLSLRMLGHRLVTPQTDAQGLECKKLMLTESMAISREFYLGIVLDRGFGGPVLVCSRSGGMDIEEVSEKTPEAIVSIPIDISKGLSLRNISRVAEVLLPTRDVSIPTSAMSLSPMQRDDIYASLKTQLSDTVRKLYDLFVQCDASQIEINPLAITEDDLVMCADAKFTFDDNARFRQGGLFEQEDVSARCPRELEAETEHLNYVSMPQGTIGCLVNGAGLAMATMDILQLHGGKPANFLDLGGGATKQQVLKSLQILNQDPNVKAIFVNIFGGITRCDVVAQGLIQAAKECGMTKQIVLRLIGNNAEEAKQILHTPQNKALGIKILYEQDFNTAAKRAVELGK